MKQFLIHFTRYYHLEGEHKFTEHDMLVSEETFERACQKLRDIFENDEIILQDFKNHTIF